jgi:methyl-accepting chemotaxis protein
MSLDRFRIGTRLGAGFAAVLVVSTAMVFIGASRLGSVAEDVGQMVSVPLAKGRLADEWFRIMSVGIKRTTAIAKSSDAGLVPFFADEMKAASARAGEIIKALEAMPSSDEEKKLMAAISDLRAPYIAARDAITKAKREGKAEEAERVLEKDLLPASRAYIDRLQAFLDYQNKSIDATGARLRAEAAGARNGLALLGVLAVLIGAGMAWMLSRSITRPLTQALEQARAVAAGDLTQRVQAHGNDETAQLLRALGEMQDRLSHLVSQVRGGVDSVSTASQEIARGNADLSQRTEQTATSLQQTASAIEQLTGTVRQTADSARTANQLASSASSVAQRGGEVVSQVVSTMEEINASSKRIADIIGTIDGIAFQTNILALNAAVEAARAGEQGRGFAVVAGEVRSLAQRSAEAAREIKSLIGSSVDKVDSGTRLVADAGSTMTEIVASVQRVSDIIGEISAAAAEQSGGIGQVNQAVTQLDQATQQNAALVEESAAAAESLQAQAHQLAGVVASFRIAATGSGTAATPTALAQATITHARRPAPAAPRAPAKAAARPASASAGTSSSTSSSTSASVSASVSASTRAAAKPAPAPTPAAAPAGGAGQDDWESF